MRRIVTESQFYMWRTLFAISHADEIVSNDELRMMTEILEDLPFSEEQQTVLKEDIKHQRDPEEMFSKISQVKDQAAFFEFARKMVWVDGDFGEEEQELMVRLKKVHMKNVNFDDLIGSVDLNFEHEGYDAHHTDAQSSAKNITDLLRHFKTYFLARTEY